MSSRTITLNLPENIYLRLQHAADATKQTLDDIFLRVIQVGSPPSWEDAPVEFQSDLAALDRLDDVSLWRIARGYQTGVDLTQYQQLLDKNANGEITDVERKKLEALRIESDRFMLRKAHAAAILRWRGHQIPPIDKLQEPR